MEKSCDLECPRNAPCRFGEADFSGRTGILASENETHKDGMHCDCPIGWTGILCDQKYETCTFQEGHECYNGGECILGLEDKYGNEQLFCDCSKAHGYVGKYCETPFAKTCGDYDGFCANGGACNPDFPELSSQACFCDEGWEGYHCEYKKNQVPDCSLDCHNGGICFIGAGKDATIRWPDSDEENMFCSCPPGFGGPSCEAPAEYCGNGHLCLNGGTCVTTSVESSNGMVHSRHHCDCTTSNEFFAGKYCENKATSICDETDWDSFFCTQGGVCKSNPLEGCSCLDGTAGFKCEFPIDSSDQYSGNSNKIQDDVEKPQHSGMLYDDDDYFHNINNSNNKRKNACGDGYCLNGGNCVTEQITMQDGISDMKEYCDCSQAYDASSKYAGLFCQYKSTSLCQVENSLKDSLDSAFCVHNGICQEDGSCSCLSGWTGQHCELKSLDLGGNSASQVLPDIDSGDTYIEVDECGDTTCYNGGICVKTKRQQSNGDFLVETHCDCSTAFDEKYLYAGLSCEFPSTELCSVPLGGQDLSGSSFCTNHGICRDKSELGCDCAPGFFGSTCEYEDETFDQMGKDDDDDDWEVCGPGICHHGGTCITSIIYSEETDTSETRYSCDCSTAYDNEAAYLGTSCEYPSTTICTPPKSGESLSSARFCVNHGTCSQDSFNDCDCRDGFEGRFCQFKMGLGQIDDDKDDDDGYDQEFELCGDNLICFNGGKCVTTIDSDEDGETFEVRTCDCDSTSNGVDFFAGSSCEYMATSFCPVSAKASFCVNGGKCQESDVCDCELPWKGNRCEFPVDAKDPHRYHSESSSNRANDYDPLTECHLKCMNGGVCVQGAKDLGAVRDSIKDIAHLNQKYAEDQFAHCACTSGWIGLTCENKVEVCGDNQHLCFHGSKCVSDTNTDRGYSCDCSQANDTVGNNGEVRTFAGDACQYTDVDICTIGKEYLGQPQYFCVNGGSCNANVSGDVPDPVCGCPQNYEGLHCEVHRTIGKKRATYSEADRLVLIAALMLPVIVMLVLVANYTRSLLLTGRKNEAVITDNGVPVTRTPFSPRRRRRSGFGKEPPSNQNSAVSDNGEDGDVDAITSVGRVAGNEGVMSDCSLERESLPYGDNQENFVHNSSEDDVTKLRGSHFV